MIENNDSLGGYIMINRRLFNHTLWKEKRVFSRSEAWIDIIQSARYKEGQGKEIIGGKLISWERGQFVASYRFLQKRWGWRSLTKVETFLNMLKNESMIKTVISQGQSIITVCNYETYNQLKISKKTPEKTGVGQIEDSEETKQKEGSNKEETIYEQVVDYLNQKTGKGFKSKCTSTMKLINGRINDGYTLDDFKKVVDVKVFDNKAGKFDSMYLRPETLFNATKFEGYFNQSTQFMETKKNMTITEVGDMFGGLKK
jgi:uncharacterized phage protein (TIGR02220 family)